MKLKRFLLIGIIAFMSNSPMRAGDINEILNGADMIRWNQCFFDDIGTMGYLNIPLIHTQPRRWFPVDFFNVMLNIGYYKGQNEIFDGSACVFSMGYHPEIFIGHNRFQLIAGFAFDAGLLASNPGGAIYWSACAYGGARFFFKRNKGIECRLGFNSIEGYGEGDNNDLSFYDDGFVVSLTYNF